MTVTDTAPLLESGSNAIGGVVTQEKIEDLPMLGRNSNALMTLVPGVRATRQTLVNPVLESHYQFFSINGSRPNQSQFMLDGGNNTNLTFNGPEYSPQVEEVREFRIQTSNFSAEYANSGGGVINVVSKSGTNRSAWQPVRLLSQRRSGSERFLLECVRTRETRAAIQPVWRNRRRTHPEEQNLLLLFL